MKSQRDNASSSRERMNLQTKNPTKFYCRFALQVGLQKTDNWMGSKTTLACQKKPFAFVNRSRGFYFLS